MKVHTVRGGGGVELHVREWGRSTGIPILFIHGWSQNHLCWMKQCDSWLGNEFRLIAFDLRGHGMSEAPRQAEHYTDGRKWAEDIAAIMDQLSLERPVVVGWSYGGFVILDYVARYGQRNLGGINFVAATVVLGEKALGSLIGPGFLENAPGACDPDVPTQIAAMRRFLQACLVKPIGEAEREVTFAFNMIVAPEVRALLLQRELDFATVLANLTVPVLVTHGRSDTVVLPTMANYIAQHCNGAQIAWYDGVGHAPFLEQPQRFNDELARFAAGMQSDDGYGPWRIFAAL